jgi:hypothetical protein
VTFPRNITRTTAYLGVNVTLPRNIARTTAYLGVNVTLPRNIARTAAYLGVNVTLPRNTTRTAAYLLLHFACEAKVGREPAIIYRLSYGCPYGNNEYYCKKSCETGLVQAHNKH